MIIPRSAISAGPGHQRIPHGIGTYDRLAAEFAALALRAGAVIMDIYEKGCEIRLKGDGSPVSEADERAEAVILAGLSQLLPGCCVVAEEASARGEAPALKDEFILVDPLDGTREFVSRNGEFTVNIALISQGAPVAGAIFAPALGELWFAGAAAHHVAAAPGQALPEAAAWRTIRARAAPEGGLTVLSSRSHGDAATNRFLEQITIASHRSAGSSLKFCLLAEGKADLYPRFGPTMDWDIAAGDAILRAAGGVTLDLGKQPKIYGLPGTGHRNASFIALGDAGLAQKLQFS